MRCAELSRFGICTDAAARCFAFQIPIVKELSPELAWGPPVYAERAKGWNYGLYTKFRSQAEFERYRDDSGHRDLVKELIVPNTDDVMAFDLEY